MTTTEQVRRSPVPVVVVAVVAFAVALLAPAYAGDRATGNESHTTHSASARAMRPSQVAFHDQMRKLWEDHITWTRLAIVTFADGSAGFNATAARLLRNQKDIGDAIKPFYGKRAGNRLTALLRDHITIAVEVLQAAKAGDTEAFDEANARWYANGNDVADAISSLDPTSWPRAAVREMMRTHLDQTLAEASAELTGDYVASVRAYDAVHRHILMMADTLTDGIVAQFPGRFR